jgi:hypothetical protein
MVNHVHLVVSGRDRGRLEQGQGRRGRKEDNVKEQREMEKRICGSLIRV